MINGDARFIRLIYRRCLVSSMLAILGSVLGQTVSVMIIGRFLGPDELPAISITLPVYYVYATAGALLGVGGTAVCARFIGQNRFEESRLAFTCVYLLTLVVAAVLTAVMLVFSGQIIGLLGVTPDMDIFPEVRDYMRILSAGGVFIMSVYPAFNLLRLDGRNKAVASIFFVMSGVCITLSYLLAVVLNTGIAGAAIAAVCGAGTSGILGAALLFKGSKNFRFTLPRAFKEKDRNKATFSRLTMDIVVSGSPSALENLCILSRTLVINWILIAALHNMTSLSAFKVTDSVNGFAQIFIAGAAGSLVPFIGVFSSERDVSSIRQLLRFGFKWSIAMIIAFTAICMLFTRQAAGSFGMGGGENLTSALPAIRIFALSLPLAAVNNILVCVYQADRNTAAANALTLGRSFVWPVLAAFILSRRIGTGGVWHSFWIAELLAFACVVALSAVYRRKNKYRSRLLLLDTEAEKKGTHMSFSVNNNAESITGNAADINAFCEANSLNPRQTMTISLAIEEMLIMICEHCFEKNSSDTVDIRILIYEKKIILRIRNGGKAFNPVAYYEQESAKGQDKPEEMDSLGVGMIVKLAETVDYRNTFGVNNLAIVI